MNFGGLRNLCYDRLGFDRTTVASAVVLRLDTFLNETQREILSMKGTDNLRRTVLPFVSVANLPYAVLPQAVVRILQGGGYYVGAAVTRSALRAR